MDLSLFTATYAPRLALRLDVQRKEMMLGPPQPGELMMTLRAGFGGSSGLQRVVAPLVEQAFMADRQPMILLHGPTDRWTGDPSRYLLSHTHWFLHAIRWPKDEKERKVIDRLFDDAAWERHYFDEANNVYEEVLR